MNNFKEIKVEEIGKDPYTMLKKDWALITAPDGQSANPMTASWGGFGVLWNVDVCYIFVRNTRYTFDLLNKQDKLSLCFMPPERRDVMNYCGANSGRDGNKLEAMGLNFYTECGCPVIEQSDMVMLCTNLYSTDLLPEGFVDPEMDSQFYPKKDYHRLYVCRIDKVLAKN